jgi:hypothetical protein
MRGSAMSARAKAMSWRWPAESWMPRSPISVSEPVGQPAHEVVGADAAERAPDVVLVGAGAPEGDVVADRAAEQERLLGDDAHLRAQRARSGVPEVDAVDDDAARRRVVEARDELGERRLARAGRADERDGLARRDDEVDVRSAR